MKPEDIKAKFKYFPKARNHFLAVEYERARKERESNYQKPYQ